MKQQLRNLSLLGLALLLVVAVGCRKEEVAEDPSNPPPPDTYVAPPSEIAPSAAANPARDGAAPRNAPAVPQTTGDEVVDKPDPTGD